ncbi:MAG: thioesterase family protein [Candidatus Nanopelagicales bacterium]
MSENEVGCYVPLKVDLDGYEVFEPTSHAGSGWGPNMQHGGPVSALLTRAMEQHVHDGSRISRVTVEILGAVPLSTMRVRSWVQRPGRRIELLAAEVEAETSPGEWRPVAAARAWSLATRSTQHVAHHADPGLPLPNITGSTDTGFLDSWRLGFVGALEWHVDGPVGQPGVPTVAWLRLAQPIVAGEAPTPLQRVLAIADVANGIGARLDTQFWTFLNTDLAVYLFEPPSDTWIGIQAETSIGHDGIAMSSAVVHGADGPIGRIAQNVLVQPR